METSVKIDQATVDRLVGAEILKLVGEDARNDLVRAAITEAIHHWGSRRKVEDKVAEAMAEEVKLMLQQEVWKKKIAEAAEQAMGQVIKLILVRIAGVFQI